MKTTSKTAARDPFTVNPRAQGAELRELARHIHTDGNRTLVQHETPRLVDTDPARAAKWRAWQERKIAERAAR